MSASARGGVVQTAAKRLSSTYFIFRFVRRPLLAEFGNLKGSRRDVKNSPSSGNLGRTLLSRAALMQVEGSYYCPLRQGIGNARHVVSSGTGDDGVEDVGVAVDPGNRNAKNRSPWPNIQKGFYQAAALFAPRPPGVALTHPCLY
jgi:hypothetical protein